MDNWNLASTSERPWAPAHVGRQGAKQNLKVVFSPWAPVLTTWAFDKPWGRGRPKGAWRASISPKEARTFPRFLDHQLGWEDGVSRSWVGGGHRCPAICGRGLATTSDQRGSYSKRLLAGPPSLWLPPCGGEQSSRSHAEFPKWATAGTLEPNKPG